MKLFQPSLTFLALIAIISTAETEKNILDFTDICKELDSKLKRFYRDFRPLSFLPYSANHYHPDLPLAMMLKPRMETISMEHDGKKTANLRQLDKALFWYWPVLTKMTKSLKEGLHRIQNEHRARSSLHRRMNRLSLRQG